MSFGTDENFDVTYDPFSDPVPMDVLLELCKKGKVDIMDIFVSNITEQYLEYVAQLEQKNYDNMSSFLLLASTLLEFKSGSLLPKSIVDEEQTTEVDSEQLFLLRMQEYKMYVEQTDKLREMEILNRFYRTPKYDPDEFIPILKQMDLTKMITAFSMLMEKVEYQETKEEPKTIIKERFTVAERVVQIIETIRAMHVVNFFSLFEPDYTKLEIINTFLALLEILKKQIATAEQNQTGGDIVIRHAPLTDKIENGQEELLTDVDGYN